MGLWLGVTGLARSGKDTFAKMLAEELYKRTDTIFVLMNYAHELKLRTQKDFDLSYKQLWGNSKEIEDSRYKKFNWKHLNDNIEVCWTPREILQNYGEFFRNIDCDFWVKHLFNIIRNNKYKNVIITDIRHPNEASPIVDSGGYIIRIERENRNEIHNQQHRSETAMKDYEKVDFIVANDGTLEELRLNAVGVSTQIIIAQNNKKRGN